MIDDHHIDQKFLLFQFQAKLLLKGAKEIRKAGWVFVRQLPWR